jgi:thioredoxin-related protein
MKITTQFLAACMFVFSMGFSPPTPPSAENQLHDACAKATVQHKKVFLMFHASWCTVCKQMEACLNDPACKKLFDDHYVMVYVDVMERGVNKDLENPGGMALMATFSAKAFAMPYWLFLDEKGKLIADSRMRSRGDTTVSPTDFIGMPSGGKELDYFMNILKRTSCLTDDELVVI